MEETNRRKSWQHRTFILLPKSKAEHICENKALLDTFNNMFLYLYGAVENVFYLSPTARFHLVRTAATVCALHRTWYESSSRCQSACSACSASALPFFLQISGYTKLGSVPPGQNIRTSRFTLPFPQSADGYAVGDPSKTLLQLHKPFRESFDNHPHRKHGVSHDTANQSWSDTSQQGHQHAACTSVGLLW